MMLASDMSNGADQHPGKQVELVRWGRGMEELGCAFKDDRPCRKSEGSATHPPIPDIIWRLRKGDQMQRVAATMVLTECRLGEPGGVKTQARSLDIEVGVRGDTKAQALLIQSTMPSDRLARSSHALG